MATLTNQNQWYDVDTQGPISTTISGYTANWTNVIQARWTSRSGTVYSVQYRCVMRKNSGSLNSNTSSYNGYSIDGTGASAVSASNTTINFSSTGDNVIATTSGSINGTSGTVTGGVKLGYYGTTWGGTGLSGSITLPNPYVAPTTPTISATATSPTSITITYGTTSFGIPSTGTVTLYGGTTASPTTSIDTTNTTGNKTFTFSGLSPETTYYFRARANNGQLNSNYSTEISVTTPLDKGLYGSVNGEAKRITKLYGSVTVPVYYYAVTSITNNPHLNVNRFNDAFSSSFPKLRVKQPTVFTVAGTTTNGSIFLRFSDNSYQTLAYWTSFAQYQSVCIHWGFGSWQPQNGNVSATSRIFDVKHVAKRITKLYGSVNDIAKQIF